MVEAVTAASVAAVLRWIAFVAASIVCGVTASRFLLPREGPHPTQRVAALVRTAALAIIATLAGRMAQQALAFAAEPSGAWAMVPVLLGTPWGWAWAGQAAGAITLALRPGLIATSSRAFVAWLVTGVVVAAPAFQGHAFGAPRLSGYATAADVVHLVAAGLWIGTLFVIVVDRLPGSTPASAGVVIRAFSPWALTSAATLGATGVFASWLHVGTLPALWGSSYGRMVLLKLSLVAAVAVVGAINWRRLTPGLLRPDGVQRLAASARVELALAAAVFAATAVLVATPLPGE
ncbi:MAG: CopD family protein [Gemmatimonadaceae bacterium]|nr:CopD family protein [Gemmatimonadaceae bacterium]